MPQCSKIMWFLRCYVVFNVIYLVNLQNVGYERLMAELQLDDLELIDACEDLAAARKAAFLTLDYHNKTIQEQHYGAILKTHQEVLKKFTDIPNELEKNWTSQVKPGDALLPADKWNKFIFYKNHIEELGRESKLCQNQTQEPCPIASKNDYKSALNSDRKFENLKYIWESWQGLYNASDVEEFASQIKLVKEAALLNEFETIRDYWEVLSDFPGAYEQADMFWEEISPFYKKLQGFVRTRLFKFYNLSDVGDEIPVFLLGNELGNDWSNIAQIILPHPQLHFDADSYLKSMNIDDIFKHSENLIENLGFKSLENRFWQNSNFNYPTCDSQLFEFCAQERTEVITCNKTSWLVYLDAHETTLKVALNSLDYASLPRQRLRYCAIDDATAKLGSLLAIEGLEHNGIVNNGDADLLEDDPQRMTRLLLTALRIIPNLAYSLMVDKWRLEIMEQESVDVAKIWWKYRKQYMGIKGMTNEEHDYLDDSRIVSNKPYISNFFGTLIAFQLFAYYKERSEQGQLIAKDFGQDDSFLSLIKNRHTTDWPYLLSIHYGLDLGTSEILKYFEPLERYFEMAPSEQVTIVTSSTSTTTTTTTTTTMMPTTEAPSLTSELVNDEPKVNASTNLNRLDAKTAGLNDSHVAMYVGVGVVVAVACSLAMAFGYKNLRRRRRTNNRRFDT